MDNEFVDIINYEGLYKINRIGQILNIRTNKLMKLNIIKGNYYQIGLTKEKKKKLYYIHRLLAIHFIDNLDNLPVVDHIDQNPQNNNLSNLRWASYELNTKNSNNVYLQKGSIRIKKITERGEYYQAQYYIDYKKSIFKGSYNYDELVIWLEEMAIKYPRNGRI